MQLAQTVAGTLNYETPVKVDILTQSTSAPKFSLSADKSGKALCAVTGNTIRALTSTGACNLIVKVGTVTAYFPFYLSKGVQSAAPSSVNAKVGKTISFPTTTIFGEKVKFFMNTPSICTVRLGIVKAAKVGACLISLKAPGALNYAALNLTATITITR